MPCRAIPCRPDPKNGSRSPAPLPRCGEERCCSPMSGRRWSNKKCNEEVNTSNSPSTMSLDFVNTACVVSETTGLRE